MDLEASTSSSPSATDLSTMNATTTDDKKRGGKKRRSHPFYRGVRRRSSGKWVSEVRQPSKKSRIWLGTFPNPEMAALAHNVAALALHGAAAKLNFPDSAHRLPRAASSAHADIQRAALQAAREFSTQDPPINSSTLMSSHNNAGESMRVDSEKNTNNNVVKEDEGGKEVEFVDEEAMFNMPLLVDCMAEGMLLTPPAMKKGFSWSTQHAYADEDDDHTDFTLWDHNY